MICSNCQKEINGERICPNCGYEVKKKSSKKGIIIGLVLLVLVCATCVGGFLYFKYGKISLEWSNAYKVTEKDFITQSVIKMGVSSSESVKNSDIKYEVTCGEVEPKGNEVKWNLKEALGECKITASYKGKSIDKTFTVLSDKNVREEELAIEVEIDLDSDEDLDNDGYTNKEEKELKTDPLKADTDGDGLMDKDEIEKYKTDPLKKDTDKDGLSDYDEILLELDPLKEDSLGDGVKDGERSLNYVYEADAVKMEISGKGNIASSLVEIVEGTSISKKNGLLDRLYNFSTEGNMSSAKIYLGYTDEELEASGLTEDNLTIYYFNPDKNTYEKIDTVIDKENKVLIATLKHFSLYVIGDNQIYQNKDETEILFVLDNSWSLYTNEQYKEYTGNEFTGGLFGETKLNGFDAEGLRFTITKDMVKKLEDKGYKVGLSEFRSDYALVSKIGTKANDINDKLDGMMGTFVTKSEGTNIGNALTKGMKEFDSKNANRFIVLLTDGQDSSLSYKADSIIKSAIDDDVKICSVGFGGATYSENLSKISEATGCKFFSSSSVDGLEELFNNIKTQLNNGLVDIDGDEEPDGYLVADSGFIANRDGFSFENYGDTESEGGHCHGMATFAELYYLNQLPLKESNKTINTILGSNKDIKGYNLNGTYFSKKQSLFDYKFRTEILKYAFGFEYFGLDNPSDLRTVVDDAFDYSKTYKDEMIESELFTFSDKKKSGLNSDDQLAKYGVTYKYYYNVYLDYEKMQTSKMIDNEDLNLLNALSYAYYHQFYAQRVASSNAFLVNFRDIIGIGDVMYKGRNGFINVLSNRLSSGDPVVLGGKFYGTGYHAINAIDLIQDIEDSNQYYIGVYDNNYPGEKRYVTLKCDKTQCLTKANGYYAGNDLPIEISISLEEDLKYFK